MAKIYLKRKKISFNSCFNFDSGGCEPCYFKINLCSKDKLSEKYENIKEESCKGFIYIKVNKK